MTTTHQDKPGGGKPRQRNRKTDQRRPKPEQQQNPKLDQHDEDQVGALAAATDVATIEPADAPLIGEAAAVDIGATGAAVPADNSPVSIQTIANAYGDYTRKSLEESNSLVERLMAVRSLDKAIEVQAEFAKLAFANFVAESQKICELYSELARQMFRPWEGFVAKVTRGGR
jgi:phasin family protein